MANNFLDNITITVKVLLAINVAMFAITYFMPEMGQTLALHYYKSPLFRPYQLLSHFFMHGSIAHIAFNMYALIMFGSAVERVIGVKKFLVLYFLSAIGAFLLHMAVVHYQLLDIRPDVLELVMTDGAELISRNFNYTEEPYKYFNAKFNGPMLGASGAIMGLLAAFGVMYPNVRLSILFLPIFFKAKYFLPFVMVIELYLGVKEFSWDFIAHFAHIGGAIIGFVLMMTWKKNSVKRGV